MSPTDLRIRREQERKFAEMQKTEELKAKQEEEKKRLEREEQEKIRKEKEELDRKLEEIKSKKFRKMSDLPAEPNASDSDAIDLGFRLPNGNRIMRKFRESDPIQVRVCA